MPKSISYCSVEACGIRVHGHGFCMKHYYRWKRHGDPMVAPIRFDNPICTIAGCDRARRKLDLCAHHYAEKWRSENAGGACRFPDCQGSAATAGYCSSHRRQQRAGVELQPLRHKVIDNRSAVLHRDAAGRKRCYGCDQWLTESAFHANKTRPDGLTQNCRQCSHGAVIRARLRNFNLTADQYQAMLDEQRGLCAICQKPSPTRRLSVDHDHACCPGQSSCGRCIRGLLCKPCNVGLGIFRDSQEALRSAADYLDGSSAKRLSDPLPAPNC